MTLADLELVKKLKFNLNGCVATISVLWLAKIWLAWNHCCNSGLGWQLKTWELRLRLAPLLHTVTCWYVELSHHNKTSLLESSADRRPSHSNKAYFPADFLKLVITELITDIPPRTTQNVAAYENSGLLIQYCNRRVHTDNMLFCFICSAWIMFGLLKKPWSKQKPVCDVLKFYSDLKLHKIYFFNV